MLNSHKRYLKKLRLRILRRGKSLSFTASRYFRQFRGTEHSFMLIIALLIGVLAGLGAVGIYHLIPFFKSLFWGTRDLTLDYLATVPAWRKILAPLLGSLLVGIIITYFSREAKGHGVPEVMEAIALRSGKIRPRVVLSKILASSAYIGAGGSVGREGPVIQIGSAIGSSIGQFLRVSPQRMKTFVACGAASGIAAAFNAPIAGAIFSLEVILGDFGVRQFSPIVISSVIATVVSRHFIGDHAAFVVPHYHLVSPLELIPYSILGLLSALTAVAFIKTLYTIEDLYDRIGIHQVLKTGSGGIIIGVIGIFLPAVFGIGYDSMDAALQGNLPWQLMFILVFAKILATSVSLGSGGSGGIFAPALFLGTMTGGAFGAVIHQFFPAFTAESGAYSLVGMAAVVAGATHAPLTAILIIFEMTNDYKIILPLMISSIISVLFTRRMLNESIYTLKLVRKGINLFAGRDINILRQFRVQDIMHRDSHAVAAATPLRSLLSRILSEKSDELMVVDEKGRFMGSITLSSIKEYLNDRDLLADLVIASDIMDTRTPTLKSEDTLDLAMHLFGRREHKILPVLGSSLERELLGTVYVQDALDTYNKELFKRDLSGSFNSMVTGMEEGRTLEVVDSYKLMEIPVPEPFIGRCIRDLDIRNSYKVEIILIKNSSRTGDDGSLAQRPGAIPSADYVFRSGDAVLILGEDRDIERFRNRNPHV